MAQTSDLGNGLVCENSDTITLKESPKPRLVAALTAPTTCTDANGTIIATVSPAGSYTYAWSTVGGLKLPNTTNRLDNQKGGNVWPAGYQRP